ncbi:ABC transporter permease [Aquabacter spiritensis]|uniref:NitT/TauT family transport system permease protein n=1 Tax=Aquabacter spiritensis TaxID=933073 RepID=A0A4R3LZI6_9HYPH|nr:ABC transporter permease [Aquabacter spiritensis]TCT06120.1 NitT/TauT family transport system permease protein [Aquabacter spiritensis]
MTDARDVPPTSGPAAMKVSPAAAIERPARAPSATDRRLRTLFLRVGLFVAILVAWQIGSTNAPAFVLPSPERVWRVWISLVATPSFWTDFGITFGRILAGFAFAAVVGTVLGLVLGASRLLGEAFEPLLTVINTVSSAIWAIFALIWFGLSNWTTIFVVFMTAMPLILTNVWQGTRTVNVEFVELAQTFRMSRRQVLTKIYLPTILPPFFSGARLAFGFGARVSLVAESLGATSGIGYRLRQAADLVQTDQVFAWTLTLIALMIVLETLILKPLERHLFKWKERVPG